MPNCIKVRCVFDVLGACATVTCNFVSGDCCRSSRGSPCGTSVIKRCRRCYEHCTKPSLNANRGRHQRKVEHAWDKHL